MGNFSFMGECRYAPEELKRQSLFHFSPLPLWKLACAAGTYFFPAQKK